MKHFLEGYHRENNIDMKWIERIPTFLKLREMVLYNVIHRSCDMDNLDAWCQFYMKDRRYRIEHDMPYVDIDFSKL